MHDTPTSKTLLHKIDKVSKDKIDKVSKDKTLPRDTSTHKIHPQKSDEEIEVQKQYYCIIGKLCIIYL